MSQFKEQYRVTHYERYKMRNRAEKHLVAFAKQLLAKPVALKIHEVRDELQAELARVNAQHPSWGTCSISDVKITGKMANAHHLVYRSFTIHGRGREIYTLLISETIMKNISLNCLPVLPSNLMPA